MARPKNQTEKLQEESLPEIPGVVKDPEDVPAYQPTMVDFPEQDAYTLSVLQSYPMYEELYIDKSGGTFTSDTAPNIRKNAPLYKNPFFKSKTT